MSCQSSGRTLVSSASSCNGPVGFQLKCVFNTLTTRAATVPSQLLRVRDHLVRPVQLRRAAWPLVCLGQSPHTKNQFWNGASSSMLAYFMTWWPQCEPAPEVTLVGGAVAMRSAVVWLPFSRGLSMGYWSVIYGYLWFIVDISRIYSYNIHQ